MKKIFSFVFAAMMLLVSSSAMAQSETLKGDVNADGVVDVADIAAIIKIMQEAGGAVEATKYYWYVGQTNPANLNESFNPEGVEGWTKLTSTPTSIDISIRTSDGSKVQWYLACPSQYGFDTNVNGVKVGGWDITRDAVEIGGVKYDVWTAQSMARAVNTSLSKL